jgi:hypothetical protein
MWPMSVVLLGNRLLNDHHCIALYWTRSRQKFGKVQPVGGAQNPSSWQPWHLICCCWTIPCSWYVTNERCFAVKLALGWPSLWSQVTFWIRSGHYFDMFTFHGSCFMLHLILMISHADSSHTIIIIINIIIIFIIIIIIIIIVLVKVMWATHVTYCHSYSGPSFTVIQMILHWVESWVT